MIQLRDIKGYAAQKLSAAIFAHVIAQEPDEIGDSEFRAKLPVWFAILKQEESAVGRRFEGASPRPLAATSQ